MSILFPKVNKPREWDYRPIYYDEEKEALKEKLARLHNHSMRDEYERRKTAVKCFPNEHHAIGVVAMSSTIRLKTSRQY